MATNRFDVTVASVSKRGREKSENEDSVALDQDAGRFAISDGASTSARPEVWSRLLVHAFVHEGADPLAPDVLVALRKRWWQDVANDGLPWFAREKLLQGAAATFVGLTLDVDRFHARAVGDSCLFHLRGQRVQLVGPLEHADQFSRFPRLVSSRFDGESRYPDGWEVNGSHQNGDLFLLMTDALAQYVLRTYLEEGRLIPIYQYARNPDDFAEFVAVSRLQGMDNDDTTVCLVRT